MSLIKVTSEELHQLGTQVSQGSQSIQDQLSTLHNQVASVVGDAWVGQASSQFNSLFEEWQKSAAGLKDSLDGISRLLVNAATSYQNNEEQIRSSF
jgi:WXG100 family type VII secretion target